MNYEPLAGKIAIVTGGSRGIGRSIVFELVKRGVKGVTLTYHSNITAADTTISELRGLGIEAIAIKGVSPVTTVFTNSVIEQILSAFKTTKVDILINNALTGVLSSALTAEDFHSVFDTNVLGGSIINISSILARRQFHHSFSIYSASKAALENLTRNLATAYAEKYGITVNSVAPGVVDTDAIKVSDSELVRSTIELATAEKRAGTTEEIADIVAWLCGDRGARWINGDTIAASGGAVMS